MKSRFPNGGGVVMKRSAGLGALLLVAGLSTGCVTRSYTITTDPPNAVVYRNGTPVGLTPTDESFLFYGNYHFTIVKDGYETLQVDQKITMPWYEFPGLDFFTENLVPWPILDRREFHYKLAPVQIPNTDKLLNDAQNLRNRGISLGGGSAASGAIPGAVPALGAAAAPIPGVPAPVPGNSAPPP